ncbi:MAG: hypothetical protein M9932_00170 [Xanthobacteraceae bacterium]|nr:hypothetical protein [Xanthobacteraceae bacterium]
MKSIRCPAALVALLAAVAPLSLAAPASADNRVFIIANQSDGYGIDECLANSQPCGVHAARAYCQSRDFTEATAYRRVDPEDITESVAKAGSHRCRGAGCGEYIAITCHR